MYFRFALQSYECSTKATNLKKFLCLKSFVRKAFRDSFGVNLISF